jgi:hypothetical protein
MSTQDKALPVEEMLSKIEQFVTESREMVKNGALLEVAGLENRIDEFCTLLLSLSQEERVAYANKLQVLLADIGKLGEEMTVLRDSMSDEIRSLTSVKKASVAYRIVDASDGYGKRNDDEDK